MNRPQPSRSTCVCHLANDRLRRGPHHDAGCPRWGPEEGTISGLAIEVLRELERRGMATRREEPHDAYPGGYRVIWEVTLPVVK